MRSWISVLLTGLLVGCGNQATLLPQSERTILEIYTEHFAAAAPAPGQRPVATATSAGGELNADTRTAVNELDTRFRRLPNPDLFLYVFPHLATAEGVPVPGYTTVFPLYERVVYALPGEAP